MCGDIPIKGRAMKFRSYVAASLLALGVLCVAAPALAADVHMFVRHEVADYATWKKAYDGFRATQKKMGVVAQAVYQSVDNPNDVTVTHDFHSLEQAKAFAASPELKSAMEKSGVKGATQIWYTTKSAKKSAKEQPTRLIRRQNPGHTSGFCFRPARYRPVGSFDQTR